MNLSSLNLGFTSLAILSAVFAAIANILARTLLKQLKSKDILGISFLTTAVTLILISPIFYHFEPSVLTVGLLILISLIDTLANYYYFKTFEKTDASIATPVLSLAPAFTFFFGWLIIGEVASFFTYFLAALIIFFVIIFSVDLKNFKEFKSQTLKPALFSSILFGISAIPSKILLTNLEAINSPTLYMFRAGLIALFALLFFDFSIRDITIRQYRTIFIRGLFVISQWVLLYYALTHGNAGVTLTLGNTTPIFVFILSVIFLREKPTLKKVMAALLVLILSWLI